MNFYISDLHFGHYNVLKYDNRPFSSIEEMDKKIIENWNSVVKEDDTVYILGDISWRGVRETAEIFKQLKGHKILIKGNHDGKYMKDKEMLSLFDGIYDYEEITDTVNDTPVFLVLSHYPILFFKNQHRLGVHLYGHVHSSQDWKMIENFKKPIIEEYNDPACCRMYNVGCMMSYMNYTPKTLSQILDANENVR